MFLFCFLIRAQTSSKKVEKKPEKSLEKDKDLSKKQEARSGRSESVSSNSDQDSLKKDDRKHGRKFTFYCASFFIEKECGRIFIFHH